ncbi:MAG: hypothetical protein ACI4WW_04555 [Candidatus Coprovivens sp.]
MKLSKIKLENEDINNIVKAVLMNYGYSKDLQFTPVFMNYALTGYMFSDVYNGFLNSGFININNFYSRVREYYNYYGYQVSHVEAIKNDFEFYFNVYTYPLDYNKKVLKKRGK